MGFGTRRRIEVPCTVEVSNTFESLHAHVVLDGDIAIEPGDEVKVHGGPVRVPYGETATFRRQATIVKAGLIEREWTRLTGDLEFMELLEFSFSEKEKNAL
nr:hypothetical protein [Tepidamorphus gemmatus]